MSVKIKRFHANQSDFTKTGRTRTEVNIPGSVGITDLTSSKVILDMHVNLKDSTGADVLLPVTFGNEQMIGAQALIRNSSVASDQHGLLCERRQANVIDANLGWYQKSRAQEDAESMFGNSTTGSYGIDRHNLLPDNPFILYKKPTEVGTAVTEVAVTRRAEIPVSWSHVDSAFGGMQEFPNLSIGDTTLRLELENQLDVVFPAKMPFRQGEACVDISAVASRIGNSGNHLTISKTMANFFRPPQQGDLCVASFLQETTGDFKTPKSDVSFSGIDEIADVSYSGNNYIVTLKNGFTTTGATESCTGVKLFNFSPTDMLSSTVVPLAIANNVSYNVAGYGSAAAPLVFPVNVPGGVQTTKPAGTVTLDALNSIPWYCGAPVQITGTDISGTTEVAISHEAKVASVKVNGSNVEIVLDTAITPTGAGYSLRVPVVCYRDSLGGVKMTATWHIDEIYAEMYALQLTPQQLARNANAMRSMEIPFVDQMLIQRNMPQTRTHTEVLQALANTVGLAVLTPQNNTFLSGFDGCSSYRFSVNGKQLTNQDIRVGPADKVGRQIHNVFLKTLHTNLGLAMNKYDAPRFDYVNTNDQTTHAIYPCVLPMLPSESVVQLQLFADADMQSKNIFYVFFRQRVLTIANGRVQVSA